MVELPVDKNLPKSLTALLTEIVDYAGLFPPAQLRMPEVVENFSHYLKSDHRWMLGRIVIPVVQLEEFWEAATPIIHSSDESESWRISVLAGEDMNDTVRRIDAFNQRHAASAMCDTLEVWANTVSKIENTVTVLPEYLTTYFEIPISQQLPDLVTSLSMFRQRAKIRTGGVTNDAFPTTSQVVRFIRTCVAANVPFKATAGLHHPFRCFKPLSYDADAPSGSMHGFVNLFLATAFARKGEPALHLEEILEDEFADGFRFTDEGVSWHNELTLTLEEITEMRSKGVISFGSCSFDEPVGDLMKYGLF